MPHFLCWSSAVDALAKGKDLRSVCRRMNDDDLLFWADNLRESGTLPWELGIIEAELSTRDRYVGLPLFRVRTAAMKEA